MAAILAVQNNILNLPGGDKTRVGIITYNDQVQYYFVREDAPEPISIIISDADDPVAPLPLSIWLLSTTSHISSIELLLKRIPELINSLQSRSPVMSKFDETRSCPTAALKSIQEALEVSGGRVFIFSSSHPNTGYGKCRLREQFSAYGQESEFSLYGSTTSVIESSNSTEDTKTLSIYKELKDLCIKCNLCVDVFMCSENDEFRDVALFGDICSFTGGNLHNFKGSMTLDDNIHRLDSELTNSLCNVCGSEAIMKLRTSLGVRVDQIIGKGSFSEINGEVELAGLDQFSTFCFTLRNDATLKDEDKVHLQLAVLYTTSNMERMVRVHNLTLVASNNPTSIFRYTDLDTVTCTLVKIAADKALLNPLSNDSIGPRSFLNKSVSEILLKYRLNCSSQSPKGQLILPESLKVLPLFILGMLKHPAFIENTTGTDTTPRRSKSLVKVTVRADERAYELRRLLSLPIKNTINSLYPRMFALHLFEDDLSGAIDFSGDMGSHLPRSLIVSSEVFESDGVYLLDEGSTLYLYIGRNVSQSRIEEWFSAPAHSRPSHIKFRHSSDVACKMSDVVDILRSESINKQGNLFIYYFRISIIFVMFFYIELKCIWQDEPTNLDTNRFSLRIVEDSIYGKLYFFLIEQISSLYSKLKF
jgi:protein transport protein SEC24